MNCDEARPLVDASVDRELCAADEWRVREHLAGCAQCRQAAANVEAISRLTRAAPYHRAPDGLAARIAAALPPTQADFAQPASNLEPEAQSAAAAPAGGRSRGLRWFWPLSGAGARGSGKEGGRGGARGPVQGGGSAVGVPANGLAWLTGAALILCALSVVTVLHLRQPAADEAFIDEIVASHVRAQISGRDLDVISTDRHTVKPWFNGRIDYAPPVEDFAAQGFPLVGGRLDYVGRERVAVLVYRYRKHVIDVYVFPPGSTGPMTDATAPRTSDGYALARWQAAGMTWWAVTDAGPDALAGLHAALQARLESGGSGG